MGNSERLVTISPFGKTKYVSGGPQQAMTAGVKAFDWGNALVDGGIIAALTFFTTLGGVTLVGVEITNTLVSAAISATAQFFVTLAIKRGLRVER